MACSIRVADTYDDIPSSTLTKSWNMVLGSASHSALLQTETEDSIESASGAVNESSSDTCDALLYTAARQQPHS